MTPAAARFEVTPSIQLAADSFGDPSASAVLMLHGGGQTRHAWHATARSLAEAGWLAVTVDQRGHGESTHPRPPAYALEDFAEDVRTLIKTFGERPPVVIGASLGGIAALLAIAEAPKARVASLILVDVAHRFRPRGGGRIVSFMEARPEGFATLADAADAVAAYLPHRVRPRDMTGLRHNLRRNDEGRWVWHWDPEVLAQARTIVEDPARVTARLSAAAESMRDPCLLVRGADSDVVTVEIAREFAELAPVCSVVEVPSAGHMVAGDNNDAFTAVIRGWLETGRDAT
jgi:pimeloyl-ACP methyl ester carboxylesterase